MSKPSSPTPSSTSPDVIDRAATKLCHIIKRPDFDGYGFNLHSEKAKPGQFIGKVDANSPAEAAGLKEGDRIIEVNGMAINSETHKQVVQRIKAIACEVRLLLVDVEGKGDGQMLLNGHESINNGNTTATSMATSKTEQVLPGASDNINSITMVSTKRSSQESQRSSSTIPTNGGGVGCLDVTDKSISSNDHQQMMMANNNNNIPPPPSATMASVNTTKMAMNNNSSNISSNTTTSSNGTHTESTSSTTTVASTTSMTTGSGNGTTMKAGSLNLTMTAAEMRAKLMMKKKYDPKNESVDLKKKYEIVQKL